MNSYVLFVFTHVLAAMGVFAALGIEAVSLGRLRRAETPAEAAFSMALLAVPARLGPIAMLVTLGSGVWMMAKSWGQEPWIVSAFVGLVGMAVVGGVGSGRRIRRLRDAVAGERGPGLSDAFRSMRSSLALTASLRLRMAIGIGIVGLMTIKPPDVATASLILATGVLSGVLASVPLTTRRRARLARTSEA
jgi:hypothetical protein